MFKPLVVLKTLKALSHELDGEPGYEDVKEYVDQAIDECESAMDPQAEMEGVNHDPVVGSKVIPHDKGPVETYPEDDDETN